jgi:acetyl-CoA acyltransferase
LFYHLPSALSIPFCPLPSAICLLSKKMKKWVEIMKETYIVSTVRTAVGKAPRGTLHNMRPDDIAAVAVKEAIARVKNLEPAHIDDIIFGCAFPEAEQGFNLGRVIAQRAGLPDSVAGVTVNRFCSSGLQTIAMATQAIMAGYAEVIIAGGAESMSLIPMGGHYLAPNPEMIAEFPKAYCTMGVTAENVAQLYHVSRQEQDAFALRSHQRALAAIAQGRFAEEVVPLQVRETLYIDGKPQLVEKVFQVDEGPRADTSLEALAKLQPVFRLGGSVTAGNSSQMSDGAAATVVMSEKMVRQLGVQPLGKLLGFAVAGVPPEIMVRSPLYQKY